jgi:hypothetical protein
VQGALLGEARSASGRLQGLGIAPGSDGVTRTEPPEARPRGTKSPPMERREASIPIERDAPRLASAETLAPRGAPSPRLFGEANIPAGWM